MAYDEFTAKMVKKCGELEQALAEKDKEIAEWRHIAEDWSRAADLSQQPDDFYQGYSEKQMRAMQALLTQQKQACQQALAEKDLQWKRMVGLDCGGHSCFYAIDKTGMRHNGPCICNPKRTKEEHDRLYAAYQQVMVKAVRFAEIILNDRECTYGGAEAAHKASLVYRTVEAFLKEREGNAAMSDIPGDDECGDPFIEDDKEGGPMDLVECPFCRDSGFDLIGLKSHFECGYCDVYESTNTCQEEREQWMKEREGT